MKMRRRLPKVLTASMLAVGTVVGWVALTAGPAHGATATGCSGEATSTNRNGADISSAAAPGRGGTESSPLKVDSRGTIAYNGQTTRAIQNGTWSVNIYGLDTLSGKITNDSGERTVSGVAHVRDYLHIGFGPFQTTITGKYHVTLSATGANGASCSADMWIDIVDSPVTTPFFLVGIIIVLLAILLLLIWGRPEALLDVMAGEYQKAVRDISKQLYVREDANRDA